MLGLRFWGAKCKAQTLARPRQAARSPSLHPPLLTPDFSCFASLSDPYLLLLCVSPPPTAAGWCGGERECERAAGRAMGLLTLHLQDLVAEVGLDVVGAVGRQNQPQAAEGESRQAV